MKESFRKSLNSFISTFFIASQLLLPALVLNLAQPEAAGAFPVDYVDQGGIDDAAEPHDLTQARIDGTTGDATPRVDYYWSWDRTTLTTTNGFGCILFDSNGNSLSDLALCVNVAGTDPTFSTVETLYTCNDTSPTACAGATVSPTTGNICGTGGIQGSFGPVVFQTSGSPTTDSQNAPHDVEVVCQLYLYKVSSATFLDICSFANASPANAPNDCIFYQPGTGTISVQKRVNPPSASGRFDLYVNGTEVVSNANNGDRSSEIWVPSGNQTIHELATNSNTDLNDYTTTIECKDLNGTGQVVASGTATELTVPIRDADDVVCIFTNTVRPVTQITLIKEVTNDGGGSAVPGDFELFVGDDPTAYTSGSVVEVEPNQSYILREGTASDYNLTSITCIDDDTEQPVVGNKSGEVTLQEGQQVTCTFVNDDIDQLPTITLIKQVINNDAGQLGPNDFGLSIGDDTVNSGDTVTVPVNAPITIDEVQQDGYQFVRITGDQQCPALPGGTVTLGFGDNITCTIINNDIPVPTGTISVTKLIVNNDGGTATVDDFDLYVNQTEVQHGVTNEFDAGQFYEISEVMNVDGYNQNLIRCIDGATAASVGASFTLQEDQGIACTITNDDLPSFIQVRKKTINDNNGQAVPGDFQLYINGQAVDQGVNNRLPGNATYTVTEDQLEGYEHLSTLCWNELTQTPVAHPVELVHGQLIVCEVTNNDLPPVNGTITVNKVIVNENGGEAEPSDFLLFVNNLLVDHGDPNEFEPGLYDISEGPLVDGYTQQSITCYDQNSDGAVIPHPFLLSSEDNVLCEIVNVDNAARISIFKEVINNDGGDAQPADFSLRVNGELVEHNEVYTIPGGNQYTVSEDWYYGYELVDIQCFNLTAGETLDGATFEVPAGADIGCIVVNDDIAPTITLEKVVINNNGGEEEPDDFELTIDGIEVEQNEVITLEANRQYVIGENNPFNILDEYELVAIKCTTQDIAQDLVSNTAERVAHESDELVDTIVPRPGDQIHCQVINDDRGPVIIVEKETIASDISQQFNFTVASEDDNFTDSFTLDVDPSTDTPEYYVIEGFSEDQELTITEETIEGWSSYHIQCYEAEYVDGEYVILDDDNDEELENSIEVELDLGEAAVCKFLNVELGTVVVTKFHDKNDNGIWDEGEPTLEGFEMDLDADSADMYPDHDNYDDHVAPRLIELETDEDGQAVFENVFPAPLVVYELSEDLDLDYKLTALYCHQEQLYRPLLDRIDDEVVVDDEVPELDDEIVVHVLPGQTVYCFVGNADDPGGGGGGGFPGDDDAALTIEKFNNAPSAVEPGDDIVYTVRVSVPEESNCVYRELRSGERFDCEDDRVPPVGAADRLEVTVVDLPPEGFQYQAGSWTASSSVRGDLKAQGITTEPTYASPGEWLLTDASSQYLVPGEVITLTYVAEIDSDQANGTYPDTAFVRGYTLGGDEILGNLHFTDTPFVGTQVTVLSPDEPSGGFVLGVLTNTGNPAILAPAAGLLISSAALLAANSRQAKRWLKRLLSPLAGAVSMMLVTVFLSAQVMAAGFWSTNIASPSDFTTSAEVTIAYQVTATDAGDEFEVTLLQDGTAVGTQTVTTPYGDSGFFNVTLPDEGSYTFQTQVANTSQGNEASSNEVTITYDGSAPSEPAFISSSRVGNTYTVRATAPAGDVVSLEIFAATTNRIDLVPATRVGTISVNPGETISFEYTAPSDQQHYFAVVAVDTAGNRSVASGDAEVVQSGFSSETSSTTDSDGDGVPDVDDPEPFNPGVTGRENDATDDEGETAGAVTGGAQDEPREEQTNNGPLVVGGIIVVLAAVAGYLLRDRFATSSK